MTSPLGLNALSKTVHDDAKALGWWPEGGRNVGEVLALVHSEVSEALEEWRNGHPLDETRVVNGKPEGVPSELADIIIRVLDFAGAHGIDMDEIVSIKLAYNQTRGFRHGGKVA